MSNPSNETNAGPRRTLLGRLARVFVRGCKVFLFALFLYLLIVLIGLIPVNNDFVETADGVEIVVTSNVIHADLVLPIRNETIDWSQHFPAADFTGDVGGVTRVAFGWGNKEFYVDTRNWSDLKVGTVARAIFWPSETCLHIEMWNDGNIPAGARKVRISHDQYRRLVDHLLGTFRRDEGGRFLSIDRAAYGSHDAFYRANGSYHAFNTCNCWVGRGMKSAGLRTGWFTPLPKTVSLYMPAAQDN